MFDDVRSWWIKDSDLAWYDLWGWTLRGLDYTADYPTLEDAVKWPDDPTKEISAGFLSLGES